MHLSLQGIIIPYLFSDICVHLLDVVEVLHEHISITESCSDHIDSPEVVPNRNSCSWTFYFSTAFSLPSFPRRLRLGLGFRYMLQHIFIHILFYSLPYFAYWHKQLTFAILSKKKQLTHGIQNGIVLSRCVCWGSRERGRELLWLYFSIFLSTLLHTVKRYGVWDAVSSLIHSKPEHCGAHFQ